MCDTSNITVGTIVMVKVGRNEIEVVVTEITANGWKVKKVGSDREFIVTRIERVIAEPGAPEAATASSSSPESNGSSPNRERRKRLPQRNRRRKQSMRRSRRKRKRKWTRPIPRRNPADRRRKNSHS